MEVTISSGYTSESLTHLYATLFLSLNFRLSPSCSWVWLFTSLCGLVFLGLRLCLSVLTTVTLFLPSLHALFSLCYFLFLSSFILWLSSPSSVSPRNSPLLTQQVSPLPQPEDDSSVIPAALPSPATRFSQSARKMRCVASVLAPQVGLRSNGPSQGGSSPLSFLPPSLSVPPLSHRSGG